MMPASFEKSCRENKFNEVHDFLTADRPGSFKNNTSSDWKKSTLRFF